MVTLLGFVMMGSIIALILARRLSPIVAFATIPIIISLMAGFSATQIGEFVKSGLMSVTPTATLFIFAILYFGIMRERGLFDPLVAVLLRGTRGQPVRVTMATVLIAAVAHLDGIGAATFLLTIPALLPLYQRLNISPLVLVCLVGLSAGVMNMMPWGGPTARAAAVSGIDATELWMPLLPVQLFGLVLMLGLAFMFGRRAQQQLYHQGITVDETFATPMSAREEGLPTSHWRYWGNLALTLLVLAALFTGLFPLYLTFMIGLAVALVLNFPSLKDQADAVARHASDALSMALVMLAAGVLLGILAGTGMSDGMAHRLLDLLPGGAVSSLHIIVGVLGVPLQMIFSPDAYYFALMPIVRDVAQAGGVSVEAIARAMLIGENTGFSVSPVVPSVYLAIGLAGVDLRAHIRFSFLWAWGLSVILLLFAMLIGAVAA